MRQRCGMKTNNAKQHSFHRHTRRNSVERGCFESILGSIFNSGCREQRGSAHLRAKLEGKGRNIYHSPPSNSPLCKIYNPTCLSKNGKRVAMRGVSKHVGFNLCLLARRIHNAFSSCMQVLGHANMCASVCVCACLCCGFLRCAVLCCAALCCAVCCAAL